MLKSKTIDHGQDLCKSCINDYRYGECILGAELNEAIKYKFDTYEARCISCIYYIKDISKEHIAPPFNQILLEVLC